MLESLSSLFTSGLSAVLSIFPPSPFLILDELIANSEVSDLLAFVNWFIPWHVFVGILEGWLLCIAVYYVWQVVLRWLKAIE